MPITKSCDAMTYFACHLYIKEMESPDVKIESQSEDIKPADSSTRPLASKKEPLIQATLSSMFKKAEEKNVRVQNHLDFAFSN